MQSPTRQEVQRLHGQLVGAYNGATDRMHAKEIDYDTWHAEIVRIGAEIRTAPLFIGLKTIAPRGGMRAVVQAMFPNPMQPKDALLTTDGKKSLDGWCQCPQVPGGVDWYYWEYLNSGVHGWGCTKCRKCTQVG